MIKYISNRKMKVFPLLIFFLFFISFASSIQINNVAQPISLGTFKQGDTINLIQTCTNSTYANITRVLYPDSSFAINTNQVVYVFDHIEGTKITLNDGSCRVVTEDYLIVVSRLNERD